MPGEPASDISATFDSVDEVNCSGSFVVVVIADARRFDFIVLEQDARCTCILARDNVGFAKHADGPKRDILEVANRRRYEK